MRKKSNLPVKKEVSMLRSSAAEYLTFIAAGGMGGLEAIYVDDELHEDLVIRNFRITKNNRGRAPAKRKMFQYATTEP